MLEWTKSCKIDHKYNEYNRKQKKKKITKFKLLFFDYFLFKNLLAVGYGQFQYNDDKEGIIEYELDFIFIFYVESKDLSVVGVQKIQK